MITTTRNSKDNNFLKISNELLASAEITSSEKIFFSYIIGWQTNGKVCFESNSSIAKNLGMKVSGLRSLIRRANKKYDFFQSTQFDIELKRSDNTTSKHEIRVDVELLKEFLNEIVSLNVEKIISSAGVFATNSEVVEVPIKTDVVSAKIPSEGIIHSPVFPLQFEESINDVATLEEKGNNEEITDQQIRFQLENLLNDLKVKSIKAKDMDTYNKLDVLEKDFKNTSTDIIIEFLDESKLILAKQ